MGAGAAIGLFAAGTVLQASAEVSAARFNEKVQDVNRKLAIRQGQSILTQAEQDVVNVRRQGLMLVGQQKAVLVGQGVDISQGSPALLEQETRRAVEQDVQAIWHNAYMQAWGLQVEAGQRLIQAGMERRRGEYGAIGTVLSGGSQIALMRAR